MPFLQKLEKTTTKNYSSQKDESAKNSRKAILNLSNLPQKVCRRFSEKCIKICGKIKFDIIVFCNCLKLWYNL